MTDDDESRGRDDDAEQTLDNRILEVLRETDEPVLTSKEIAAELGSVTRQHTHRRLNALHERGDVAKKEVGPSVVWYLAE